MNSIKQVHTNEGTFYTDATHATLEREKWRYIRRKRREGMPWDEILFAWGSVEFRPAQTICRALRLERDARRDDLADLEETATGKEIKPS